MKVRDAVLREVLQPLALNGQRRMFFGRAFETPPRSLQTPFGWYSSVASWRKNVDEFDRLLLGIAGPRKFGLHFSSGNWYMSPDEDPSLNALQTGQMGELHYYGVDLSAGTARVLDLFPRWANDARNYLFVIDRQHLRVKEIEAAVRRIPLSNVPLQQIVVRAESSFPVYTRSEWLVKEPIPLFSRYTLFDQEKMAIFAHLGLIYQSVWKQTLQEDRLTNFYLMLFAIANGLRLIEALEKVDLRRKEGVQREIKI